eukprot:8444194-Pyramimonas_sp.AAC.3
MFIDKEWLLSANCLQVGTSGAHSSGVGQDRSSVQGPPPIKRSFIKQDPPSIITTTPQKVLHLRLNLRIKLGSC